MRRLGLAALVFVLFGCDKAPSAVVDTPAAAPRSASGPAAPSASPMSEPAPAGPKQGPTPDDPLAANQSPEPMPPEASALASASNRFAFELWARTSKASDNTAISPASISIAMAMTRLGAKGETSAQIKKTMHFDGSEEAVAASWGKTSRALSSAPRSLKLRIANRLYGEQTFAFEKAYLDQSKTLFGAALEPVDFKNAPDASRLKVNEWVSDRTERKIVDLLPPASVDKFARLILVNAVYFLASWADPFEKTLTADKPFEISAKSKKSVPTMSRQGRYPVAEIGGAKVLELAYRGGEASMIVVLPTQKDGLGALEKTLDANKLSAWRKAMSPAFVSVELPRFEISPPTMALGSDLAALGMPLAFDKDKADFTGMGRPDDPANRLYVGKVQHKAFVKVDETGTEAAAATAVVMAEGGAAPAKPVEFHADHPFLFFIVDRATNLVLFMGRVTDPSAK